MRTAQITRTTAETDISLTLNLDGSGLVQVDTGCGFFDHMLTLFARHARFDLTVKAVGDLQVDAHHTVEDVGIVLGRAFAQALGDGRGIHRYGSFFLPMDESLALVAVDCSGRSYLVWDVPLPAQKVGTMDTELAEEFMQAFSRSAALTLHAKLIHGSNTHHILEAVFKGLGRALKQAVALESGHENEIPSTKGTLL